VSGWGLAWRLARRELKTRFRGLRLLLVCLFLGVGAIAAIGSLTTSISQELAARGQVILGGDVEFQTAQRRADADERAAMNRLGRVSELVRLRSMAVRDGNGALETVPIELKAVDGRYPLYGSLTLKGAVARPLAADQSWVSAALADRMNLKTGDAVRFGGATFRVVGIIADEPDRLSGGFSLGPVAIISLAGLERTKLIQPGSLYDAKYRVKLAGGNPDAVVGKFTQQFPDGGWETRTRDRASPGTSRFVERMGEFLVLVGLAALAIAGIGVGNGVSSYLAARRQNIATLKVLGATSGTIAQVYLIQIVLVAMAGIFAGLIAGVTAVPLLIALAGDVLPVAPQFAVHPVPLLLAAAYGLLIALAFTAVPLLAAGEIPAAGLLRGVHDVRRVPLRRALPWVGAAVLGIVALVVLTSERPLFSGGFLAAVAGVVIVLALFGAGIRRLAARTPPPRRPLLRLAIAGLHRPGAQTGALVVALGLGLTLFVLLAAIRTSLDANIARTIPARAPALFALDVPRDRLGLFDMTVKGVEPNAKIATVPLLRGIVTGYGNVRVADLKELPENAWVLRGDRGLTYAATLPPGSTLTEGTWWGDEYRGPPLVSVDTEQAAALGLKIGDALTVSVLGSEVTAKVASFRRVQWDTMGFNFVLVFSPGTFDAFPHNLSATIEMPPAREGGVTRALLGKFPSVSVIEVGGVLAQVRDVVGQMAQAIAAAASIAILAGIAVLIGAIAAAREVRTYDGVMLKVLGASRAQVLGVQIIEYVLLAVVLAVLALALGLGSGWYVVTQIFDFQWLPDYGAVAATLGAGALLTLVIGVLGTLPILSVRPARALREL
jgi:putative ABC transport system permease protein